MAAHTPYLVDLNERLAAAADAWPEQAKGTFALATLDGYVDGRGFRGRGGEPDAYYTAFALRTLAVLRWDIDPIRPGLLKAVDRMARVGLPDLVSAQFTRCTLGEGEAPADPQALERLRCDEGGYAKAPGGAPSTYATFLVGLSYDMAGRVPPAMEDVGRFILTRRRDDGGFAELTQMPIGSVNPTAAGTAMAMAAGVMDESVADGVRRFLLQTQRADGGWPAGARVTSCDLLSTFTALLTLSDLGAADRADLGAAERFVRACRVRPDGFGGSPDDGETDVEYTFYGIGSLAILGARP